LKILKKFKTASLNSEFTGSYKKKVYLSSDTVFYISTVCFCFHLSGFHAGVARKFDWRAPTIEKMCEVNFSTVFRWNYYDDVTDMTS